MRWALAAIVLSSAFVVGLAGSTTFYDPESLAVSRLLGDIAILGDALPLNAASSDSVTLELAVKNRFGKLPLDPWGRPYVYRLANGRPDVYSLGRDGVVGGEDLDFDYAYLTPEQNARELDHARLRENIFHYSLPLVGWLVSLALLWCGYRYSKHGVAVA